MKSMTDYFKAIFKPNMNEKSKEDQVDSVFEDDHETRDRQNILTANKKKTAPMPKIKVNASIKEFRVALIENIDTPKPQALTLKVSNQQQSLHIIMTDYSIALLLCVFHTALY